MQYYNLATAPPSLAFQRDPTCYSNSITGSNHITNNIPSVVQPFQPGNVSGLGNICPTSGTASAFTSPHNFNEVFKREAQGIEPGFLSTHAWHNFASFNSPSAYPNVHSLAQMMAPGRNTCRHGLVYCQVCYENYMNTYGTCPNFNVSNRWNILGVILFRFTVDPL